VNPTMTLQVSITSKICWHNQEKTQTGTTLVTDDTNPRSFGHKNDRTTRDAHSARSASHLSPRWCSSHQPRCQSCCSTQPETANNPYRDRCKTQASHTLPPIVREKTDSSDHHRNGRTRLCPPLFHNKWRNPEKDRWHFAPLLPPVMTWLAGDETYPPRGLLILVARGKPKY